MTDIGIRRIFNSDHDLFRQSVRKFFQTEVQPYHAEYVNDISACMDSLVNVMIALGSYVHTGVL